MLNQRYDGSTIDENKGLARELARMNLTLNAHTWYWKTDLLNLMNFLNKSRVMPNMR